MMNSSLGDLNVTENYYENINIRDSYYYEEETNFLDLKQIIWLAISSIICCFGLVGNGYIIWLLVFQIKRNSFTTFILNLAIADGGYLASLVLYHSIIFSPYFQGREILDYVCILFIQMMYINENFLLTAISIDRCVAVLFPIWHRCSRPKDLSITVCILLWISSFLLCGIMTIINFFGYYRVSNSYFLVTGIVCLPLTTLSTLVLFIKVCLKSNQRNQGRLLLMILITLFCFIILAFPLTVLAVIVAFHDRVINTIGLILNYSSVNADNQLRYWFLCIILFSCLNSSINPVIYFLVGRKKGSRSKESMKVILQKVFKEAEETGGR